MSGNSLRARIQAFFAANPGEELSLDDIATKFSRSPRSVQNAISAAAKDPAFLVERVSVYRLKRDATSTATEATK